MRSDFSFLKVYTVSYVGSNSVLLLQMVVLLPLCCQRGEELRGGTYGMRNRRRNIYASLEV